MNNKMEVKARDLNKRVIESISNCEKELRQLEGEASKLKILEDSLVFTNIKELYSTLYKIDEHNYTTEMQDMDTKISIAVNLLSWSLALLIAFVSVPQLGGNYIPAIIGVIISTLFLIKLIFDRKKLSNRLKLTYLEGMNEYSESLLQRTTYHLDFLDRKAGPLREKIKALKIKMLEIKEVVRGSQAEIDKLKIELK